MWFAACTFEGRSYGNGDKWKPDTCSTCSCLFGRVECTIHDCAGRVAIHLPLSLSLSHSSWSLCKIYRDPRRDSLFEVERVIPFPRTAFRRKKTSEETTTWNPYKTWLIIFFVRTFLFALLAYGSRPWHFIFPPSSGSCDGVVCPEVQCETQQYIRLGECCPVCAGQFHFQKKSSQRSIVLCSMSLLSLSTIRPRCTDSWFRFFLVEFTEPDEPEPVVSQVISGDRVKGLAKI